MVSARAKYQRDRVKFFLINRVFRGLLDLGIYLFWLVSDPAKFTKVKTKEIKNLLVIYGGAIGDAYNAIGLVNTLNKKYPSVKINYLTLDRNHRFVRNPAVSVVNKGEAKKMIRSRTIDAVVLLQGAKMKDELFDKELYSLVKKVKYRVECDAMQINPRLLWQQIKTIMPLTRRILSIETNGFIDHVKAFRSLGFDINVPSLYIPKDAQTYADQFAKKQKIEASEKLIFLHTGGGTIMKAIEDGKTPSHAWQNEKWSELADRLIKNHNARIILTGVPREKAILDKIHEGIKNKKKVINLCGKTSIEESAALMGKADLIISIDTGTAHVAAQTGSPLIILFSSIHPRLVSPITSKKIEIFHQHLFHGCRRYACKACFDIHMGSISVDEVYAAAQKFLKQGNKN